jgi:hypothetical protein
VLCGQLRNAILLKLVNHVHIELWLDHIRFFSLRESLLTLLKLASTFTVL